MGEEELRVAKPSWAQIIYPALFFRYLSKGIASIL
jgi:hypothetical protein